MREKKKCSVALGALALAGLCTVGAALAAGGSEQDPLVTLSYLNETAIPQILSAVETSAAARQTELTKLFDEKLAQQGSGSAAPGTSSDSASFTLLTLQKGQVLKLEVGCEVLLRVGSMTVSADSSPALIDTTSGGTIGNGAALEKNHLYLATIADRSLRAAADTVMVLVRGGCTTA